MATWPAHVSIKQVRRRCEGPVAQRACVLQDNEAALLRIQDPGMVLRHMKGAAAGVHDRDALMEVSTVVR